MKKSTIIFIVLAVVVGAAAWIIIRRKKQSTEPDPTDATENEVMPLVFPTGVESNQTLYVKTKDRNSHLNLREKANDKAKILAKMAYGEAVVVIDPTPVDGKWYHVKYTKIPYTTAEGYAYGAYLVNSKPE